MPAVIIFERISGVGGLGSRAFSPTAAGSGLRSGFSFSGRLPGTVSGTGTPDFRGGFSGQAIRPETSSLSSDISAASCGATNDGIRSAVSGIFDFTAASAPASVTVVGIEISSEGQPDLLLLTQRRPAETTGRVAIFEIGPPEREAGADRVLFPLAAGISAQNTERQPVRIGSLVIIPVTRGLADSEETGMRPTRHQPAISPFFIPARTTEEALPGGENFFSFLSVISSAQERIEQLLREIRELLQTKSTADQGILLSTLN